MSILNQFNLKGKKAIVVGGAGDLGFSMVTALYEANADIVVIDLSEDTKKLIESLDKTGKRIISVCADISKEEEVRNSFSTAINFLGGIDILINSAGIQIRNPSESFQLDDWNKLLNINLTSAFLFCQLASKLMIEKNYGKIINISSMQSFIGGLNIPAYAASKGGIVQLTKTLSNEWAGKGINVNAIAPGYMDTKLNIGLKADKKRFNELSDRIPAQRWGTGNDLKGITVFLSSDASNYITGANIPVDGGFLCR